MAACLHSLEHDRRGTQRPRKSLLNAPRTNRSRGSRLFRSFLPSSSPPPFFSLRERDPKHWKTFKDVVENGIFSAQVRLESVRFPVRRRNLFHGSSNLFCRWITARPYPSGAARGCETRGEQRQKEREEARIFEADGDERKG